jgi:hypothetical protein
MYVCNKYVPHLVFLLPHCVDSRLFILWILCWIFNHRWVTDILQYSETKQFQISQFNLWNEFIVWDVNFNIKNTVDIIKSIYETAFSLLEIIHHYTCVIIKCNKANNLHLYKIDRYKLQHLPPVERM